MGKIWMVLCVVFKQTKAEIMLVAARKKCGDKESGGGKPQAEEDVAVGGHR